MTFDLDLWPTDLKINKDHLLTKDYLPTKFEASGAKRYWVISCTRLRDTDIPTDRPTCATQYAPPSSKGGIIISRSDKGVRSYGPETMWTDRQTEGQTDGQTGWFLHTPPYFVFLGGIINTYNILYSPVWVCIGVLRHMQWFFSYIYDGTDVQADWRIMLHFEA